MTQDCIISSPLKKGDVIRIAEPGDAHSVIEMPSNNNRRWSVMNETIEKVPVLFPKHFNGFKHSN